MEINLTEETKNRTTLGRLVLHCISQKLLSELVEARKVDRENKGALIVDVVFTVNGHPLNVEKFINHCQNHVEECIKEEAKSLYKATITDKIYNIEELLDDLSDRVQEEVNKRLEDWEIEKNDEKGE